jgi:hypothetical protein
MAAPSVRTSVALKECEVVTTCTRGRGLRPQGTSVVVGVITFTCGKDVATVVGGAKFTPGESATPWRASDHHWYAGNPSRGTAPASLPIRVIWS